MFNKQLCKSSKSLCERSGDLNLVAVGKQVIFKAMKLMKSLSEREEKGQGLSLEAFSIRRMMPHSPEVCWSCGFE